MRVWDVQEARARATDPETSKEAARSVKGRSEVHAEVIRILKQYGPCTDEEIEGYWFSPWATPSGRRSRRAELVKLGKVEDSGERKHLSTGRQGIAWRLVR